MKAKSAGKQAADVASEEKQKMDSYMGMAGNTVKVQGLTSMQVFFLWGRNGLSVSPELGVQNYGCHGADAFPDAAEKTEHDDAK
jgi:hypothetical protein